jgi:hypothetical protein
MNNTAEKLGIKDLIDIHNDPSGEIKVLEGTTDTAKDTLLVDVSTLSCPYYAQTFQRICKKLKKPQHKKIVIITTAPSIGDEITREMIRMRLGNFTVNKHNISFKRDNKKVIINKDNPIYVQFVA